MSKIEQNIIQFISKQDLLENGDKLLIALSGGPDSIFALHFFNKFRSKFGIDIAAMHVNHLLRGDDSDKDELFCRSFCNELKINYFSIKVDVKSFADSNKQSIEEAARNLRYQKLSQYASEIDASKIVTAHNLEDNTETVLLNLFRGTGLKGAAGIPIQRNNIIRPLLSTSKSDILNYLDANKIDYRIDSSNLENDFTRNYLRNEIIPKIKENINSGVDNNIFKFSEIVYQSESAIHDYTNGIIDKFITEVESGIEISNLIAVDKYENIFPNVIKLALEREFQNGFTFDDISKIRSLFTLQVGSKVELSHNIFALKEREFVLIDSQNTAKIIESYKLLLNGEVSVGKKTISAKLSDLNEVEYSSQNNIEFIDRDSLKFPLTIRKWENGEKFNPIGLKGTKKISDFLTEAKVNSKDKREQLVLADGNKIIWVIGHRLDESVIIKEKTKKVVKLLVRNI